MTENQGGTFFSTIKGEHFQIKFIYFILKILKFQEFKIYLVYTSLLTRFVMNRDIVDNDDDDDDDDDKVVAIDTNSKYKSLNQQKVYSHGYLETGMSIIVLQAISFKGLQSSIVIKGTKTKQNFLSQY